jgi:hypothetical protein
MEETRQPRSLLIAYKRYRHPNYPYLKEYQGKGELKPATAINVRHILCEKHSRAMEALEKIQVRVQHLLSEVVVDYERNFYAEWGEV